MRPSKRLSIEVLCPVTPEGTNGQDQVKCWSVQQLSCMGALQIRHTLDREAESVNEVCTPVLPSRLAHPDDCFWHQLVEHLKTP